MNQPHLLLCLTDTSGQALNPSTQTLPYLLALSAAIEHTISAGKAQSRQLPSSLLPEGGIWPYLTAFVLEFDPIQVRYAGEHLLKIVNVLSLGASQTGNFIPSLQLLHNIILRLDQTSSTFTSTHHTYVRLCLRAGAYAEALDIIDRPIYHIPTNLDKATESRSGPYRCSPHDTSATYLTPNNGLTHNITSRVYLEYYMMAALCYVGAGQFKKALIYLEIVLVAPTQQNVASLVMVEAYKKWLLLNLIVHGSVPEIPKSASSTSMRHIKAIAKPYECLADVFKIGDLDRLRAEMTEGGVMWNDDGNHGLVGELLQARRKFSILRLGETYAALPVAEIAHRLFNGDSASALSYLQGLIQLGQLSATISSSQGGGEASLRFLSDTSTKKSEAQVERDLAERTLELRSLLKHVSDLDHRAEVSKEYINFLRKLKVNRDEDTKKGGGGRKANAPTMDDLDEDVMDEF